MGRHLHRDGEGWSLARERRNHWKELDNEADVSGFKVIKRRRQTCGKR